MVMLIKLFNLKAMNWEFCLICQAKEKPEPLKCPLDSFQDGAGIEAYRSFLNNIVEFRKLGSLPVELTLKEDISVDEFCTNRAVWHKSCHLKFANSKLERAQQKIKRKSTANSSKAKKVKRQVSDQNVCIFCGEQGNDLHQVLTLEVDRDVKEMAVQMQDSQLITKLAAGDMFAIEAKCHSRCMLAYKCKYIAYVRSYSETGTTTNDDSAAEACTFAELISFMESLAESGTLLFKLSSLHDLYVSRLRNLHVDKSVNKTRLKNRIIGHYHGEIKEQSDGKNTVLAFNQGIETLLKDALKKCNCEEEAFRFVNVAKYIRNDVFQMPGFSFSGEFKSISTTQLNVLGFHSTQWPKY